MTESADFADVTCIILAGGQGKRMGSSETHKSCFLVAGTPAIVRSINTFKQAGLQSVTVVVGELAEQVMSIVTNFHNDTAFVYQSEQLGTGHAALVGIKSFMHIPPDTEVIVSMGDSIIKPGVVDKLHQIFKTGAHDLVITSVPKKGDTTSGRIVRDDDNSILGITETADIENARKTYQTLTVGGREFDPHDLESKATSVNVSLYAFRLGSLHDALTNIGNQNAQSEMYLTDTVEYLALDGKVKELLVTEPQAVMAFNTPAELQEIEEMFTD